MPKRIPWNQYEVSLLFEVYFCIAEGANPRLAIKSLSRILRRIALQSGQNIDDTYRNAVGIEMQLANVQYIFTNGEKGLSSASQLFRQMHKIFSTDREQYYSILKEAIHMTEKVILSAEDAFFLYAEDKMNLSPEKIFQFMKDASDYCNLKESLLGMTDVNKVRNIQYKIDSEKLQLRLRYKNDAQEIVNVVHLYYTFIKKYNAEYNNSGEADISSNIISSSDAGKSAEHFSNNKSIRESKMTANNSNDRLSSASDENSHIVLTSESDKIYQTVDFSSTNSYSLTTPVSFTYKNKYHEATSWRTLYIEVCQLLFADHRDSFLRIIQANMSGCNPDTPAFADEQNSHLMRKPVNFAPGYYLETDMDDTTIVKNLSGLHKLLDLSNELKIEHKIIKDKSVQLTHSPVIIEAQQSSNVYDWNRPELLLVDFAKNADYSFTQPEAYEYNGVTRFVSKWIELYREICGNLFNDYRDTFMSIMNGDIPGCHSLSFADEEHKIGMREPHCFAPGYYLESKLSATSIVRKLRGLYQLFNLEDRLRISYVKAEDSTVVVVQGENSSEEWIIRQLNRRGLPYRDNRSKDGCLWIVGGHELDDFFQKCREHGYTFIFKPDGCNTYPKQPVWWTRNSEKQNWPISDLEHKLNAGFRFFLLSEKHLTESAASLYIQAVLAVAYFLLEKGLNYSLDSDESNVHKIFDTLMSRDDFIALNNQQNHQYSIALDAYISYLHHNGITAEKLDAKNHMSIKDAVIAVLQDNEKPLTLPEITREIKTRHLHKFSTGNPSNEIYVTISRQCRGMKSQYHGHVDVFDRFIDDNGQFRYTLIGTRASTDEEKTEVLPVDERWLPILKDFFPNGYILNDFLSQFQATGYWQERYGDVCPVEGDTIDRMMKALGTVRDNRVYPKSELEEPLISDICAKIVDILSSYSSVNRSCLYERYQNQLAGIQIYTEPVMTQQLLKVSGGRFYSVNQVFVKPGQPTSITQDCRKVLRDHGVPMPVNEIAEVLWFIPYESIHHTLSADDTAINIGNSTWMLVEDFPLTMDDARQIGDMLSECFLSINYIQAFDLLPLLQSRLPSIAENLTGFTYKAVFNMIAYYLKDRFTFSKAIISPKGTSVDFTVLFKSFALEHEIFTLADLESFAQELKLPIYWESIYAGGAVRVCQTDFVNKSHIKFDTDKVDHVLENLCPGDYLPIQAVSSAMMIHLPPCGYNWNGYLLLCYVLSFSKVFRLLYSSLGKTGFYGAMVRKSCKNITNYGSLIERVLTDDNTWTNAAEALDLLVNQGYQALRKYKGIEAIVEKVQKNKKMDQR